MDLIKYNPFIKIIKSQAPDGLDSAYNSAFKYDVNMTNEKDCKFHNIINQIQGIDIVKVMVILNQDMLRNTHCNTSTYTKFKFFIIILYLDMYNF